jgi:putative ABC transport system permease protein
VVSREGKTDSFAVIGDEPAYARLETMAARRGRLLNALDIRDGRKVAVIGPRVAATLFGEKEDPVGRLIEIKGVSFQVVGVYQLGEAGGNADWLLGRVFIPFATFGRVFGTGTTIGALAVLVEPGRSSAAVDRAVRAVLKARHSIHPDDPRGVGGVNRDGEFRKISNLIVATEVLIWTVSILTIASGAFGVSNIMMIAVSERTREIGIRKAIGASPASIFSQIILESTVLTGLAGYLGLVCGVAALEAAAEILRTGPRTGVLAAPEFALSRGIAAVLILAISGIAAGLAPARAAVAINPVEAFAHE